MPAGDAPDPTRATLVAILQQLNRVESMHEGRPHDQALELPEIAKLLDRFWAVDREGVKVPVALGLLVRNRLVDVEAAAGGRGAAAGPARYRITADGKRYLVEATTKSDRIA